jgi:sedoheptulose-bisphosphatase
VQTILDASRAVSLFIRHSPIIALESTNKFGDLQLHQDVRCDEIIEEHLRKNPEVRGFASEERPQLMEVGEGEGYYVTYDPLDGSSIIDTNFAIGSIFSVWRKTPKKLIGERLRAQVNALLVVYGPRTTAILYNAHLGKVQEFTLVDEDWIVSHPQLVIEGKNKIFSPGNLRCAEDHPEYLKVVEGWITKGYTLRYTGGLIVDVAQIFIKKMGVFCCVGSPKHKFKLRALYEAAAVGFLIEKAGGKSMSFGGKSMLDYEIKSYDDRMYLLHNPGPSQWGPPRKSNSWHTSSDPSSAITSLSYPTMLILSTLLPACTAI